MPLLTEMSPEDLWREGGESAKAEILRRLERLEQCEAALRAVCGSVTDDNFWNVVDDVPLRNAIYALYEILEWPKPERRDP